MAQKYTCVGLNLFLTLFDNKQSQKKVAVYCMLRSMRQTVFVGQADPKTYKKHLRVTTCQKSV